MDAVVLTANVILAVVSVASLIGAWRAASRAERAEAAVRSMGVQAYADRLVASRSQRCPGPSVN